MPEALDLSKLEPLWKKYQGQDGALIPILQEAQAIYGYLPEEVLKAISENLKIPMSRIYGVVTFYAQFYLNPRGRHTVRVCRGTACHVRGGKAVRKAVQQYLGIGENETTPDFKFTFETVACLGAARFLRCYWWIRIIPGSFTPAKSGAGAEAIFLREGKVGRTAEVCGGPGCVPGRHSPETGSPQDLRDHMRGDRMPGLGRRRTPPGLFPGASDRNRAGGESGGHADRLPWLLRTRAGGRHSAQRDLLPAGGHRRRSRNRLPDVKERADRAASALHRPRTGRVVTYDHDVPFYQRQMRTVLSDNGRIDPTEIRDYLARGDIPRGARPSFP